MHSVDPFIEALPSDPREQAQFALDVGVSASTIWRWKNRLSRPTSHATRDRIAREIQRRTGETTTVADLFDAPATPDRSAA
jgi:hypothetical protein